MSDASLTGSRSRSRMNAGASRTRGSMANAQTRRGGRRGGTGSTRKSRVSYGSRSRFNTNNSSQNQSKVNRHKVIVDGMDVTPLSLLPPAATADGNAGVAAAGANGKGNGAVGGAPAAAPVKSSLLQRQQLDASASAQAGKGLTVNRGGGAAGAPARLTAAQLEEDVVITLTETDTVELFHLRGYVVHQESDQQRVVAAQNDAYKALFERRENKDLFSSATAQTTNLSLKNKKVQAEPPLTRDVEVTATNWDIYDSQTGHNELEEWQATPKEKDEDGPALAEGVQDLVTMCLATPGSLLNVDAADVEEAARKKAQVASSGLDAGRQALQEQASNRILSSAALNDSLRLVERIIQQGYYHDKQLAYHDLPPVIEPDANVVANVSTRQQSSSSGSSKQGGGAGGRGAKRPDAVAGAVADGTGAAAVGISPAATTDAAAAVAELAAAAAAAAAGGGDVESKLGHANAASADGDADSAGAAAGGAAGRRAQYLELQWSFQCDMTRGRNVSCMVWNPKNANLLAVSYGSFDCVAPGIAGGAAAAAVAVGLPPPPEDGMILFWSLKNPEFPERALRLPSGVTSIDFSTLRPYLLAAGLYDGTVAIFDTRLPTEEPVFQSDLESGRHSDTVWQVKWIVRGGDHDHQTETLVSVSTDGRVKEWSLRKGLSHVDLMTLKRVANQTGPQWQPVNSKGEGVISRLGNGLCFSFPAVVTDTVIYFVGTEDGVIHKCSSSYNEQYLASYHGHTGPVYKIKCHPANPGVFLSCSADWAVKLWSADREADSELTFHQMDLNDVVHDVEWAPHNATVFASVTADGRIEVWDVRQSVLTPAICHWVDQVVDEVARAKAQEAARLEELKKKKKKKRDEELELDEFGDGTDQDYAGGGDGLRGRGGDAKASELLLQHGGGGGAHRGKKKKKGDEPQVAMRAKKLSCVRFADGAQIVVTGDDTGAVDVYKIFGVPLNDALHQNKPKELALLRQAMRPEQVGASNRGGGGKSK